MSDIFLLEGLEFSGPRGYYQFEAFVLQLLQYHLKSQDKELIIQENERAIGDAIAKNGFDNFIGKTVIEIRLSVNTFPDISSLLKFVEKVSYKSPLDLNFDLKNILLIFSRPLPDRYIKELNDRLFELDVNLFFWGPKELQNIVNLHKEFASTIINNLLAFRLETASLRGNPDWEKERELILSDLATSYHSGHFSLFLGAGVSASAGMPDWSKLLSSMLVNYVSNELDKGTLINDKDIEEIVERINEIDDNSALMSARYLRRGIAKTRMQEKEFRDSIAKNLYSLRDNSKNVDSDLIKSIAKLSTPKRTGAKIRSIVTYNFDDLLEKQLSAQALQYRSIFLEGENYHPDELPVYHVHGFLPEEASLYEGLEKGNVIFSEEGYHQLYTDTYHWSNLVQLNQLREHVCLMIGLSMTDPNLRRLLDISSRNLDKARHYAFMRRLSVDRFLDHKGKNSKTKPKVKNKAAAEEFLKRHHSLNEEIMKELGVYIIWFNEFVEIPEILNKISYRIS